MVRQTHRNIVRWLEMCVMVIMAVIVLAVSAAGASATVRTRSCGETSPGYPVRVRATPNVSCSQAKAVMDVVFANHGTKANPCYRAGRFHRCTVQGFSCFQRGGAEFGHGRCTKGRHRLIIAN